MELDPQRASELRALGSSRFAAAERRRRLDSLAWGVLILSFLLSLWFGVMAWRQAEAGARARFNARADAVATALATHMNAYEDTVRAAAAVLEAQPGLDPAGFQTFARRLRIPNQPAGVHGLGFARRVTDAELPDYLARQRGLHGAGFRLQPDRPGDEHVVIDLIYPDQEGMRRLLGKDVFAEPARREAMQRARDSGQLSIAPLVSLTDTSRGNAGRPGFLLYSPVYDTAMPLDADAGQRRTHLRGYATAGFGWAQVMQEVAGEAGGDPLDLRLLAREAADTPIVVFERSGLRERHGADMRPAFRYVRNLDFLGGGWELTLISPPTQVAIPGLIPIAALTVCGLAFGVLMFLLLRSLARAEHRSRALLDAVADHLPALIAYVGRDRRYGFTNRATRDWFSGNPAWTDRAIKDVHAGNPAFLDDLRRAMEESTSEHGAVWETRLGDPERPVQAYLVPDVDPDGAIAGWYLMATDTSEQKRAQREISLARDHLKRITDRLPAMIAQYDREERTVFFNRACQDLPIWHQPYSPGVPIREMLGDEHYARRRPYIDAVLSGRDVDFETSFTLPAGPRRMHVYYKPDIGDDGEVNGFLVMAIDISDKARLENALHDATERAEVTLSSISEAVVTTDTDGRVTYVNPAAEAISGWTLAEAIGVPLEKVLPLRQAVESDDAEEPGPPASVPGDLELARRDGRRMLVKRSHSPLYGHDESLMGSVMVLRDITEERTLSARMAYLAHHDSLTTLPNRLQLNEALAQSITNATHRGTSVAVLFIDLDLFKHVNDALGHHIGDQLLQQVAKRIQRNIGNLGTVYRTGGDEFVVLLDNVVTRDDVILVAERLLAIGGTPYTVASHELHQAFSIGVSLFPEDGYDAPTLMMRSDAAMYLAKRNGRNAFRFYTRELASSVDARIELESSLRRSLRNGDLILYYQPQIDRLSGRIVGVEGLVRWKRGDRLMLPGEFLPIAEETNLIVDLDQWAIRAACRQSRQWQQAGLPPIRVSVNVAAANFDTDTLLDTVVSALEESGLAAEHLELEVTETTLMRDVQRTDRILRALKAMGVRIAIDDFGTGFSSLSYLGNYGFNVLKIDQSFVRDVTEPNQGAITRAIIGLAGQLQCRTVAEGVETQAQLAWLVANGCDELQGNLFSPPVPASDFAHMFAGQPSWFIPQPARGMHTHWS